MHINSKTSVKVLIVTLFVLFLAGNTKSQSFAPNSSFMPHWQIQLNGGTSLFFGDVKQYQWWPVSNYENEWRGGLSLQLKYQISPVFGIRGQGLYGKLGGTRRAWKKYFDNNYYEFNINSTININNIFASYRQDRFFNAYVIVGLGLLNYNTYVYQLGSNKKIQTVGGGAGKGFGGRTLEGVFHGGLGFDLRINDHLSVNLESANRIINSDMLDGRISGFKYDVYNYTSVGLSYKFAFSKKHKGPEMKSPAPDPRISKNKKISDVQTVEYDFRTEPVQEPDYKRTVPVKKTEEIISEPEIIVVETPVVVEKEVVAKENNHNKPLEYRVQILAKYGKTISLNKISEMYNIPASMIKQDTHNGYYIYTVGSYSTYLEAQQKRNQLRMQNGIGDAFVVAFQNGNRLSKLP
ncbi:MAG: hypothetical protein C0595_01805 [Marinilabiliales bacterium]|nr:MAG: hypothetical protein C0595_01805 [Marinilabiliales bacterium]